MRKAVITSLGLLGLLAAVGLAAEADGVDEGAVLEVKGRGVEGKPPYRGGGVVKFLDASLGAQIVHYQGGDGFPLPLQIGYDVLQPAPVMLTSRLGTEYWRLYDFGNETMTAAYTDEQIDLAEPGRHTAEATRARFNPRYGPLPDCGLVGIRGHYYFLIDRRDGDWLDVTDPPAFFDRRAICRKLTFTLADLSEFSLSLGQIQSTWQPGGPFRVRLTVTDAEGRVLPVVNAPLRAAAGDWHTELCTEWAPLDEPTGWTGGRLPDEVPEAITIRGTVTALTAEGPSRREVAAEFRRGEGRLDAEAFTIARQGYEPARNAEGTIRETRAIWISTRDIATAEGVDVLVKRCREAGLNVLIPDIFVRNTFVAKTDLMPTAEPAQEGFDPLGDLIEKAHAAGLEVHPWFCVTYRDRAFRSWFREKHGTGIDMLGRDGEPIVLGADVHRAEYRRFVVELMAGVARDYPVDGIHLDYIRSMGRCYCRACGAEFAAQFGTPLSEATEQQWIRWQRRAVGEIVRQTAERVRKVRPRAIMSAAVFSNLGGGAAQGQDPGAWARHNWLDLVLPMDYRMQTLEVRANERQFLDALDDDGKLVTGLSLYARSGGKVTSRTPELVREQIELVRRLGIHGYCLFAYSNMSDKQWQMLRDELNAEPAVPYFR